MSGWMGPRIRTVKPEVAKHELLFDLEQELRVPVRFAWVLLFGHCDREGRFKWRPNALKTDILPYDDCDFSRVLDAWVTRGLLVRYRVGDAWYGWVPTFRKHQAVNPRESASELPPVDGADEVQDFRNQQPPDASLTGESRVPHASPRDTRARALKGREVKGREGNPEGESSARDSARASRATRLPDDFELTEARRAVAKAEQIDPDREFAKFVDYWRAAGGANARKADWEATWRNWCRRSADGSPRNGSGRPGRAPYVPALSTEQVEREIAEGLRDANGSRINR